MDPNELVQMFKDPLTGASLPFIDMAQVKGRLEMPDIIYTYVPVEQQNGGVLVWKYVYPRWPGVAGWVEQPVLHTSPSAPPAPLPPLDFEAVDELENSGGPFVFAADSPSPTSRTAVMWLLNSYTVAIGVGLILAGIIGLLGFLWQLLRGV